MITRDGQSSPAAIRSSFEPGTLVMDLAWTVATFDPTTGEPAWQRLSGLLKNWHSHVSGGQQAVPLGLALRAWDYLGRDLEALLDQPRSRHVRDHALLPLHKVRELDSHSVAWLAKQPGRTAMDKAGSRRSALAVIRPITIHLPENKVLSRILNDLEKEAVLTLAGARGLSASHCANEGRMTRIQALERCCRMALTSGPLAEVKPAEDPQPNNVLLSDSRYSKVWTAWNWLRSAKHHLSTNEQIEGWMLQATVLTFLSSLLVCRAAHIPDQFVRLAKLFPERDLLEGEGELFSVEVVQVLDPTKALSFEVTFSTCDEVLICSRVLSLEQGTGVEVSSQTVKISTHSMAEDGAVRLCLSAEDDAAPEILIISASLEGLVQGAKNLEERLIPPGPAHHGVILVPSDRTREEKTRWEMAGCAFAPPYLSISTSTPPLDLQQFLGLAARHGLPRDQERWLHGAAASWDFARNLEGSYSLAKLLPALEKGELNLKQRAALRVILSAVIDSDGGPASGAALAIAIGDHTTDAGLAQLMAALPHSAACSWIWRSVAAVLAWRDSTSFAECGVAYGDAVLVLDGDGINVELGFLVAKEKEGSQSIADPWQWERFRVPELHGTGATTLRAFTLQSMEGTDQPGRTAILLDGGWHSDLSDSSESVAWLPDMEGQNLVCVQPRRSSETVQCEQSVDIRWLSAFLKSEALTELLGRCEGNLHILAAGQFTSVPSVWEALEEGIRLTGIKAQVHPAPENCFVKGSLVFLDRKAKRLPTWCERIPELFLRTSDQQMVRIFDGRMAEPGQPPIHYEAGTFEIPADCTGIEFDLIRKYRDGGDEVSGHPWLTDHRLHSTTPVKVRIQVSCQFAEEAFTITLLPIDRVDLPDLKLDWSVGENDELGRSLKNSPPELEAQEGWENLGECLGHFRDAAISLEQAFNSMNGREAIALLLKARNASPESIQRLKAMIQGLKNALDKLDSVIRKDLWLSKRSPATTDQTLLELLHQRMIPIAGALLPQLFPEIRSEKSRRQQATQIVALSQKWVELGDKDPSIKKDLRLCKVQLLTILSHLRGDAPNSLPAIVMDNSVAAELGLDYSKQCHIVGRSLKNAGSNPDQPNILNKLMGMIEEAIAQGAANKVQPPLWALTTSLFTYHDLVYNLSGAQAERLLELTHQVLLRLDVDGEWSGKSDWSNQTDLFREVCPVLMALLRLRGRGPLPQLSAGSQTTRALADLVQRVDAHLPQGHKKPRLPMDGNLPDTLRGARIAKIRHLES